MPGPTPPHRRQGVNGIMGAQAAFQVADPDSRVPGHGFGAGQTLRQVPTLWLQDVILTKNNALYLVSPYGKVQRIDLKR